MHNIDFITENFEDFLYNISQRDIQNEIFEKLKLIPDLNLKRKEKVNLVQNIERENNEINSKKIPPLKQKEKSIALKSTRENLDINDKNELIKIEEEIFSLISLVEKNNLQIKNIYSDISAIENEIKFILDRVPNVILGKSKNSKFLRDFLIPIGEEKDNLEIRKWGQIKDFNFKPKSHEEIGELLNCMDFEQTAKISGSRFVTLSGKIASLERALMNFMIDEHTKNNGYKLFSVPYMVKNNSMYGVGQLPKFSDQSFICGSGPESFESDGHIENKDTYRLIPTAEVSLTNLVREKIIKFLDFPIRMVAATPCFRSEVGSGGRDVSGIIRMHQFLKVELVSIVLEDELDKTVLADHNEYYNKQDINQIDCELERMSFAVSRILELLNLPYRIIVLASKDMGFSSRKTYDFEVWFPSQNKYREISSCSYCGDFQARRMNSRYKNPYTNKNIFAHTLNGSGLAVGRTLAAIIENYQTKDGDFEIPEILTKYM
jgi:seryl-tRNA synthetase